METSKIEILDSNQCPINLGSVLKRIDNNVQGVVSWIGVAGSLSLMNPPFACVGDIEIKISGGTSQISNQYSMWAHIPHEEQTYWQRYTSWLYSYYYYDNTLPISKDEDLAINGIMSLLPYGIVNWEHGPWPDKIEDALSFLANYLTGIEKNKEISDLFIYFTKGHIERRVSKNQVWECKIKGNWTPAIYDVSEISNMEQERNGWVSSK